MQTAEAYATSLTISNVLINQAFGGLIVLSAVIHPIIDRVYAHDPATRRFASVLSAFLIDVIWGNILPIYVFVKYASLDRTIQTDQIFQRFGSGYYEIAQRELRHLVILSWPAFLLSIFPLVSSLISLHSLMRLLSAAKRINAPPSTEESRQRRFPQQGDHLRRHR